MAGRRLWYLAALFGCWVFYIAYGEWFSWLALLIAAGLPWLSLILSIPAILSFRLSIGGANAVAMGTQAEAWLLGRSGYPMPPFRGKIRLKSCLTGQNQRLQADAGLPTAHCGGIAVTVVRARVCDYLGLFAFPVRKVETKTVLVRPRPLPVPAPPDLERYIARTWKPKSGGGFAENHELRLYRPGDSLNQIHWKLSAKTGKWMIRQAMEPQRGRVLLTMTLRGSPEALDRKFGRLLWLGSYLVEKDVRFELRVLTGEGIRPLWIRTEQDLEKAIDTLLCTVSAREGSIRDYDFSASWQYHIGGEPDEA